MARKIRIQVKPKARQSILEAQEDGSRFKSVLIPD